MVVDFLPTASLFTSKLYSTNALLSVPLPPRVFTPSSMVNVNCVPLILAVPISFVLPSRAVAFNLMPVRPVGTCRPGPRSAVNVAPGETFLPV